ncbi:MAG: MlaC/ttg2D family ABC transporter substrate-binding protein [Wenzhouxiangella sp.]
MKRLLLAGFALLLSLSAVANTEPVDIIRGLSTDLFALVDDNRSAFEANPELLQQELREQLLPHLDTVHSARLVLGRHGRSLERQQVEAFAEALAELLMSRYADGLLEFRSRDQVEILPQAGENTERATRVRTRVRLPSGQRAQVDYVLRKAGEEWRVFDVIIEGISYVATFRNQIGEEIRRHGFDAMLARLQAGEINIDVEVPIES